MPRQIISVFCAASALVALSPCSFAMAEGIEEIIVTASPIARSTDQIATSVVTVDRDEIARRGSATLGELLEDQPGVSSSSFARGASRPVIRGLDNFRVRVQENGIGSQDVSALSEDHGIPIDPLAVQKVEIIRGPAVLRYGSSAIGGVVSVLNDRIPASAPEGGMTGEVFSGLTSVDNGFEGGALMDFGDDTLAGHIDVFYRHTDDYEVPDAPDVQANSRSTARGFAVGGSRLFDKGYTGLSFSRFESEYGIPGGEAAEHGRFLDIRQDRYAARGEWDDIGDLIAKLRLDAALSDYAHNEVDGVTGEIGSTFRNDEAEARVELVHQPVGNFEGAFGLQFRDRSLEAFGEGGELIAPSQMSSLAAFFFEDLKLGDKTSLQLGARIEQTRPKGFGVTPTGFDGVSYGLDIEDFGRTYARTFTPASVSIGLVQQFDFGVIGGLTAQRVERAPDLLELFARGPHEATETFEIGNPDIVIERAVSFEISVRRPAAQDRRLAFEASAYHTAFTNFIFKQDTGFFCGDGFTTCGLVGAPGVDDELRQIVYLQADTTYYGAELSGSYRLMEWPDGAFSVGGRYDFVKAEFDGGGNMPRVPPARYGLSGTLDHKAFHGRVAMLRVDDQSDVAGGETETKGYTDLRVEVSRGFAVHSNSHALEVGVTGSNLLDEAARNHISFKKEDVLLPGRSLRLFVKAQF